MPSSDMGRVSRHGSQDCPLSAGQQEKDDRMASHLVYRATVGGTAIFQPQSTTTQREVPITDGEDGNIGLLSNVPLDGRVTLTIDGQPVTGKIVSYAVPVGKGKRFVSPPVTSASATAIYGAKAA